MERSVFFNKYNICDDSELELLPQQYRDGSRHYYHEKTNYVYSQYIVNSRYDKWYLSAESFVKDLIFQKFHKKEYDEIVEKNRLDLEIHFEKLKKEEDEYRSRFLQPKQIIDKYTVYLDNNMHVVFITKEFLNDVIENKHILISMCRMSENKILHDSRIVCPIYNLELQGIDIKKDTFYDNMILFTPSFDMEYNQNTKNIERHGIIYDLQFTSQLYIKLGGVISRINHNTIIPLLFVAYTTIDFVYIAKTHNGNNIFEPAYGMKFKHIHLTPKMMNELNHISLLTKYGECTNKMDNDDLNSDNMNNNGDMWLFSHNDMLGHIQTNDIFGYIQKIIE